MMHDPGLDYTKAHPAHIEKGFGFVDCEATWARYKRDVFLHSRQAEGVSQVEFTVHERAMGAWLLRVHWFRKSKQQSPKGANICSQKAQ